VFSISKAKAALEGGLTNEKSWQIASPQRCLLCLYLSSVGNTQFRDTFCKIIFENFSNALQAIPIKFSPSRLQCLSSLSFGLLC
jgi:hypothetical protein